MSKYDEPNHLSPEPTLIKSSYRGYSEEDLKAFQHGLASPFMPKELALEIQEENKKDLEYSLKRNEEELSRFLKGGFKK